MVGRTPRPSRLAIYVEWGTHELDSIYVEWSGVEWSGVDVVYFTQ